MLFISIHGKDKFKVVLSIRWKSIDVKLRTVVMWKDNIMNIGHFSEWSVISKDVMHTFSDLDRPYMTFVLDGASQLFKHPCS